MKWKLIIIIALSCASIKTNAQSNFNVTQVMEAIEDALYNCPACNLSNLVLAPSSGSGNNSMSYWEIQNTLLQLNQYYIANPGSGGCDGNGSSWDQCGVCGGNGTSCTPPPTPDCNGDIGGGAYDDPNCGCIGGNTGFATCEDKDPCSTFVTWVNEHQNGDITSSYFNRNKTLKVQNGVCTSNTNPSCNIDPQYWNEKSASEKYYYHNGNWILYNDCGISCIPGKINNSININTVNATPGKTMWCSFYCLSALHGGDACTYATYYYQVIMGAGGIGCSVDVGTFGYHMQALFSQYGYNLNFVTINNECDLIALFQNGKKAVLDGSPGHNSLIYGVHRSNSGVVTIDKFDTSNATQWDNKGITFTGNYHIGGDDYAIQ